MPKKKQPRNAFFFFMLDYKERCERNGEKFPNGLKDVQLEAGPEWDAMPAQAKKKYEDMAKEEKLRLKGDTSRKETCWHNSFDSVDRKHSEEEEARNVMNEYIAQKIRSLAATQSIPEHDFYLIHVNYFCISEYECYHPAELAICRFNLRDGIKEVYSTIIDPGQIPLGYRHDAMQKSETTHKIPIENNGGEKEFYKIFSQIKKFLQPGIEDGCYPPMFTMPDSVNLNTSMSAVKSVLDILVQTHPRPDRRDYDSFRIYNLERLFFELQSTCRSLSGDEGKGFPSVSFALSELEADMFNYTMSIACKFHQQADCVEYCSMSYVKRWVFIVCDHCCQDLGINIIQGCHVPEHADVNYRTTREQEEMVKKQVAPPKPITWVDHSKIPKASGSNWVPVEHPPLPRPRVQADKVAAWLPPQHEAIDVSEDNFPSIAFGRGRGKPPPRGSGRGNGNGPMSFAAAMKK